LLLPQSSRTSRCPAPALSVAHRAGHARPGFCSPAGPICTQLFDICFLADAPPSGHCLAMLHQLTCSHSVRHFPSSVHFYPSLASWDQGSVTFAIGPSVTWIFCNGPLLPQNVATFHEIWCLFAIKSFKKWVIDSYF
jgi:hypothetical protein